MEQAYGSPVGIWTNEDNGQLFGLYGVRQIGVAIQFFDHSNGVGFICLEDQTK
jgi:hypothetical protein